VWANDGRRVTWSGTDGAIRAIDAETGELTPTRSLPDGMHPPVLSADGRRYASFDRAGRLYVWDIESEQPVLTAKVTDAALRNLGFAPDGLQLAVSGQDSLRLWDIAAARDVHSLPQSDDGRSKPA